MPLTKRQKEILDYIDGFIAEQGYAPSFEEIAESFGYSSLATVHEHLSNLERKGYIRKSYNESRSIEMVGRTDGSPRPWSFPSSARWPRAFPSRPSRTQETLAVPPDMVRRRTGQLRAPRRGQLHDRGADPGRRLHRGPGPANGEDGEMVVALVGGDSATVKKLYREPGAGSACSPPTRPWSPSSWMPATYGPGRRGRGHPEVLTSG